MINTLSETCRKNLSALYYRALLYHVHYDTYHGEHVFEFVKKDCNKIPSHFDENEKNLLQKDNRIH